MDSNDRMNDRISTLEVVMSEVLMEQRETNALLKDVLLEMRQQREATDRGFHQVREELHVLNDRVTDLNGHVQRIEKNTINTGEELRERLYRLERRMDDIERKAS